MGKYSDAFEKYENEQHRKSTRVAGHQTALKDHTQSKIPSRRPPEAQASPEAAAAPESPNEPVYTFQLQPPKPPPETMAPPEAATAPEPPDKPVYNYQIKPPQPPAKKKAAPKARATASAQQRPTAPKPSPPLKKQPPKAAAASAEKAPPAPAVESAQRQEKSAVQKGVLRANGHKIDPNLVSILKPFSFETDLFKTLRGKILFPVSGKPPKSIMVTSAIPGEGKSFVASNLAVNLAQNIAEYVLLVDCDLRRPRMHKMFGFDQVKGLSDHLANGTRLYDLLLKTAVDKLTLLPGGSPPLNPSEILSSAKMANLIDEVKTRYDDRYLIIDSPPPMLAPETSAIAKRVDGIIIVIKYGDTPLKLIEEMMASLDKEKIIGAVLNRFDTHTSGYYGYTKYRKYYQT